MTDIAGVPVCAACRLPFTVEGGCAAPGAARFERWDGDEPCNDCAVVPGTLHHAGCDVAECVESGSQGLSCDHCGPYFDGLMDAG